MKIQRIKRKKWKKKKNKNENSISTNITTNKNSPLYFRKMFVGGLHPSLTTETLINYFSQFGEIEKGIIMTDKLTGKSRGFGFIIFSHKETVDKIMAYSNCHFLYGKWVECKRAQPKIQNMKMLDDNESFPKLNYQNNNFISHSNITKYHNTLTTLTLLFFSTSYFSISLTTQRSVASISLTLYFFSTSDGVFSNCQRVGYL